MKTKNYVLGLFLVGVLFSSYAGIGETSFRHKVTTKISYPELRSHAKIDAEVYVEFKVNENCEIEIIKLDSSDQEVKDYVIKKLQTIVASESEREVIGKTFKYRFSFQVQR